MESKNKITNPHDKLFRASMSHPEVARDFLQEHLTPEILSKIDLSKIAICPGTFVDEDLKLSESDVLFECMVEGEKGFIYILAEHQSTQDPLMPFRLLKYMVKIWDYFQADRKKKNALPFPVIFPLVFYTGSGLYKGPRAIWELCGKKAELMQKILKEPFHLIDLNLVPEERLTSRKWAGTMEFLLRHQFRRHIEQEIGKVAISFSQLFLEENKQFVLQLLSYIIRVDEEHRTVSELNDLIRSKLSQKAGRGNCGSS